MRTAIHALAIVALGFAPGTGATAQHSGDIWLGVNDGHLVTGAIDGDQTIAAPVRAFGAELAPNGFTSSPGFDALPGTFAPGTRVGFNVRDALAVWNDAGFEGTAGEAMSISFFTAIVETADGFVPGFDLAVQANGGWHKHLSFFLNRPDDQPEPAVGVYLLELEMYSTDSGVATSAPFWLVFNYLDTDERWQAALAWIENEITGCRADLDADGVVAFADLIQLLFEWGPCEPPSCSADLDGDGTVAFGDLLQLLFAWGPCS